LTSRGGSVSGGAVVLLEARGIVVEFGGFRAVRGADLTVAEGEIVGLIGPNGAGKSTLFNVLAGDLVPAAGSVAFAGRDVTRASPETHARLGIARTYQVPRAFGEMTVAENVLVGAFLRHPDRRSAQASAGAALAFTGLDAHAAQRAASLGTAGRKRLEIARALATEPAMLLLDEALAGLNPTETREAIALVRRIHQRSVTLVIVEHVMEVILTLAERAVVFHRGQAIAVGPPQRVVTESAVISAYLGHRTSSRGARAAS
jgi:branched-chain amino acid transport system ATP-binding protein